VTASAAIPSSDRRIAAAARRPPVALFAAAMAPAVLVLLPIAVTVIQAADIGPARMLALLARPLVGRLLLNTAMLIVAATLACAVIGAAAAWCVERTDLPGRRIWAVLAAAPLAIPPFVTSFAWISLSSALEDFAGALLVVTTAYFPMVYLPVAAALRGMDPALEEVAQALGRRGWDRFFRVVLPQLRPALLGGMLLVALNVLVEFGAFSLLRFRTFTTEIYAEYRTGFAGPQAALLASVLIAMCLALLFAETRLRGRARYARLGAGTRRQAAQHRLGWARLPVLGGFAALAAATIGMPVGMVLFWLTQPGAAAITPADVSPALLFDATAATIGYGLAGAAVTMLLALPLGYLATRYDGWAVVLLERAAYVAQGVPGIVVALALVAMTVQAFRPLYQSAALLVIAYAILFLPLALVSVRTAFMQSQRSLEEAARSLGLRWPQVAWRVILPLAGPGLRAAAALVFVSVAVELTSTLLLAPIGTKTLATQVWADTSTLAFAAAAPYAALMLAMSLGGTWLLARRFGTIDAAGGLGS
jgi:iron(III) transport system permease protein